MYTYVHGKIVSHISHKKNFFQKHTAGRYLLRHFVHLHLETYAYDYSYVSRAMHFYIKTFLIARV